MKLLANLDKYVWRDGNTTCWHWAKYVNKDGYGLIGSYQNKVEKAHRVAYREAFGGIPLGMHVLHKCDVRDCVNPAHLYVGTNAHNVADRVNRGRSRPRRGEAHGRAKLTVEQVREIRERWVGYPGKQKALAAEYGVSQGLISQIVRKAIWATV